MDKKKLMHILLRDAVEIEKIIAEIREAEEFDPLDMELLQTRISGMRHLLEVAFQMEELSIPAEQPQKIIAAKENLPVEEVKTEFKPQPDEIQPKAKKEKKPEKSIPLAETLTGATKPLPQMKETAADERMPGDLGMKEKHKGEVHIPGEEKHILAEKFTAGKSINDLLLEKSTTESKFTLLPLSSLAAGIGTNERFLFTRELFNGDMDHFQETIRKLDAMQTIQDATAYLRENFTWDKNETSLRFIELIKRRFTT